MPRIVRLRTDNNLQSVLDSLVSIGQSQGTLKDRALEEQGATIERRIEAQEAAEPVLVPLDKSLLLQKYTARLPLTTEEKKAFKEAFGVDPLPPPILPAGAPVPMSVIKSGAPPAAPAGAPAGPAGAPAGPAGAPAGPPAGPPAGAPAGPPATPPRPIGASGVFRTLMSISHIPNKTDCDATNASVNAEGVLNHKAVAVSGDKTIVTVEGVSVPLTEGLAVLLLGTDITIGVNKKAITKDDLTAYLTLMRAVGVQRATVVNSKVKKLVAVTTLITQNGAGSTRRGRTAPPTQSGKVGPDGSFGDYSIDVGQLGKGFLHVSDRRGTLLLHQEASPGLRHLLTKHATAKQAGEGLFLPGDLRQYHQLAEKARLRLPKGGNRTALLDSPKGAVAFLPDDEKVLGERLKVLEGMRGAGDQSKDLVSEGVAIADRLLKKRWISKREHEERVRGLLG